jgi:hypothetical protein
MEEINKIASSSGYQSVYGDFVKFLKKSRKRDITNIELFDLQMEIANRIIKAEKSISFFKKAANRESQNKEWFSREVYKAQRWAYKQIMDGVAWRFLNFDRASLRQIAEHNQTGNINPGFVKEMYKAKFIVENSDFYVILNDLTNFLRFGDLTIVSKDKIYIDEVKTKGGATTEQKEQLRLLLDRLNKKKFSIGKDSADYLLVDGNVQNFLPSIEKIMKKAKTDKMGISSERVSPYLYLSCIYSENLLSVEKDFQKIRPFLPPVPFTADEQGCFIPMTNLFLFGEFSPNFAPYTIFPFEEELIADLVLGKCILSSHISQKRLDESIRGKGWGVEFPTKEEIANSYDEILKPEDIKKVVWDPKYHIQFSKGKFRSSIAREILFRINSEFLSVKAIVNSLESTRTNYGYLSKNYVTGFKNESSMWV